MSDRVMIAMSGGVDSSVTAYLVTRDGTDAVGATLRLFTREDIALDPDKTCCSLTDAEDAARAAEKLGIPHYIYDFGGRFREAVIDRFIAVYREGGTPNPCIDCNRHIKFRELLEKADELNCSHIATGHYARVEYDAASGRYLLMKAADARKDQTYVLWALKQDQLARTIFPLGGMTKDEVRKLACELGLGNADKPDSQDICFVPDGDYARFITSFTHTEPAPGDFLDTSGKVIGRHQGIIRYTIGQRKHLGIALGRPVFVTAIDPAGNTVTIGDEPDLYARTLYAHDINLIAVKSLDRPLRVTVKARYAHKEAPAVVEQTGEDTLRVTFDEPQRALTRGQSAVLYDGDVVVGGGVIFRVEK